MARSVWGIRLLWLFAIGYVVTVAFTLAQFSARAEGGLRPTVQEFTPTYGAALQLRDLAPESLYEREPMLAYTRRALTAMYPALQPIWLDGVRYPPWLYPPHFTLLVAPLALLPYWWAYLAWTAGSALPYLAAMGRILPARIAWPFALAAPPVFYNVLQGQTGFLTAGFIGLGLALLRTRPLLAGLCIGAASIKPHFGLLIPVALIAGGHWRAAGAAAAGAGALAGISLLAFGPGSWSAFFAHAAGNLQGFEGRTYNFIPMVTPLSALAMAGVDMATARALQFAAFVAMLALVAWAWWRGQSRPGTLGLQGAILCTATPLALPMAYIYDLVLLAPAIAWIGLDLHAGPTRRWEWPLLVGAGTALLAVVSVADSLHVQIGPLLVALLLGLAVHRYRRRLAKCPA